MHSLLRSIAVSALVSTAAFAQTLPQPDNRPVHIRQNINDTAIAQLTGSGISLGDGKTTAKAVDGQGHEIVWREVRSGTDNRGVRHVFYRQYLRDGNTEAELVGSEVGVHYTPDGKISSISGTQFNDVTVANRKGLGAAQAIERVLARLQNHPNFHAEKAISAADRFNRLSRAQLKLVQSGGAFHYAWFTSARNTDKQEHQVVMDADSEDILSVTPLQLRFNCYPSTPYSSVSAVGEPVRPDLRSASVTRSLLANVATYRPDSFTREAFYQGTPYISITQDTDTDAWQCSNAGSGRAYTLLPVTMVGSTPTYRDNGEWHGYAGGDAMYKTKQTMDAFASLGRAGWDNSYGDSNIVLDSTIIANYVDGAFFEMSNTDPRVPPTPYMGIAPASLMYGGAASLDHIAHEWGHGVIFTSAAFPTNTNLGLQMHEGWADVIGQIVEHMKEPSGTGIEQSSDWVMHEDGAINGTYCRGALDDGTGGHYWQGPNGSYFFNDAVHRQDEPTRQEAHDRGNMLSMVLRLMSEGGQNPICSRESTYQGCGTNVTSVGFSTASNILFNTVTWYTPSTATWEDLPTYASDAAFDLYNTCGGFGPGNAIAQQNSVNKAFTAIGYPRLTSAVTCN